MGSGHVQLYNFTMHFVRLYFMFLREPLREMDRYRLIAEVHKRPALWDPLCTDRSRSKVADLWREVASLVGGDLTIDELKCKWKHMRDAYRTETKRALHRIDRDKRKGRFDPNKRYGSKWEYYDLMKFIDIKTRCNCNNCSKNTKNPQQTQQQRHVYLTSPPPLRKFNNLITHNNTYYEINVLENHEKDDEIRQRPLSCHSNNTSHHNSIENLDIKEESVMDEDIEGLELHSNSRYHRVDSEEIAATNINHNETSEVFGVNIKEERCIELDSDCIYPSDEEEFLASHNKQYRKDTSVYNNSTKKPRLLDKIDGEKESTHKDSTDINDPDTNFLISFSAHMKSLNQLQNLQFRCKMSELILNMLTNTLSSTSSSLANQESTSNTKTFIDNTDPDYNFLISFRLHLKSMNQLQNLQFRAKMCELMVNILQPTLTANENNNTTISDSTTPEGCSTKNPS